MKRYDRCIKITKEQINNARKKGLIWVPVSFKEVENSPNIATTIYMIDKNHFGVFIKSFNLFSHAEGFVRFETLSDRELKIYEMLAGKTFVLNESNILVEVK